MPRFFTTRSLAISKVASSVHSAYAQSKLALKTWSFRLTTQLKDVTFIAVRPGSRLNTKMIKEAYSCHWAPINKEADILCELILADEHKTPSGEYYDNDSGG